MNDDQLTILVYAVLIVVVLPGLYGLIYMENDHSFIPSESDSLEYVSVEKESLSQISVTNILANSSTPSASFTLVTVTPETHRIP